MLNGATLSSGTRPIGASDSARNRIGRRACRMPATWLFRSLGMLARATRLGREDAYGKIPIPTIGTASNLDVQNSNGQTDSVGSLPRRMNGLRDRIGSDESTKMAIIRLEAAYL